MVSIQELKATLSSLVAEAAAGGAILITRHKRVVARLGPPDAHVHVGRRFGRSRPRALLRNATAGRYLDVIADDRRGGAGER